MNEKELEIIRQLTKIADGIADIHAVLNAMVTEGLVTLPDVPASDN
jgi:phage tail protein X